MRLSVYACTDDCIVNYRNSYFVKGYRFNVAYACKKMPTWPGDYGDTAYNNNSGLLFAVLVF